MSGVTITLVTNRNKKGAIGEVFLHCYEEKEHVIHGFKKVKTILLY